MSLSERVKLADCAHGCIKDMLAARTDAQIAELVAVLRELADCAEYWSEYDVPIGIHDRIKAALAMAGADE